MCSYQFHTEFQLCKVRSQVIHDFIRCMDTDVQLSRAFLLVIYILIILIMYSMTISYLMYESYLPVGRNNLLTDGIFIWNVFKKFINRVIVFLLEMSNKNWLTRGVANSIYITLKYSGELDLVYPHRVVDGL